MIRFITTALIIYQTLAGWCDDWGTIEWSDEFEDDKLDTSKWSVVCNDLEADGCESLPFLTHVSSNGAECRSAVCVPEAVSVGDG